MYDHAMNVIRLAMEAAYDTLKQPPSAYLSEEDFELDREDAIKKIVGAARAMKLSLGQIETGFQFSVDPSLNEL